MVSEFGPRGFHELRMAFITPIVGCQISTRSSHPRNRFDLVLSSKMKAGRPPPNLGQPSPDRATKKRTDGHHDDPQPPVVIAGRQISGTDAQQQEEEKDSFPHGNPEDTHRTTDARDVNLLVTLID